MKTVTSIHKLGVSRGTPLARVWLEGKRLQTFGFPNGQQFIASWKDNSLLLECASKPEVTAETQQNGWKNVYAVAGTKERPIIDISGDRVREQFKGFTHVQVKWNNGRISITGHKE